MPELKVLHEQTGFSLLEVLIAISIFAVGMLAVAGLQASSINGNLSARETTQSAALGQAEVERLLSLSYDHPELQATEGAPRNWSEGHYRYHLEVIDDELFPNTKTIQLAVEYSLKGQVKRTQLLAAKADSL